MPDWTQPPQPVQPQQQPPTDPFALQAWAQNLRQKFFATNPGGVANEGQLSPYTTFQAQNPNLPQQNYAAPINQAISNAGQNYNQQQDFINMLQQRANGQGPSVAQGLLNQATQQNLNNVASQVASNRSLSPQQAARLAIEGGVQSQGQAAGQAATLRAQEQLANTGALQQALATQGGQNLGLLGTTGGLQGQQVQQQLAGNLATQGMNEQAALANLNANLTQGGQNLQGQQNTMQMVGSILGGFGSAAGAFGGGGAVSGGPSYGLSEPGYTSSPLGGADYFKRGGPVPGEAKVDGDSYSNDTVHALLSPGEVVLPRHVTQSENAPEKAAEFMKALLAKKNRGPGKFMRRAA